MKEFLFLAWSIGMLLLGATLQHQSSRDQAVKSGHAEYYLDENYQRQWRWKQ